MHGNLAGHENSAHVPNPRSVCVPSRLRPGHTSECVDLTWHRCSGALVRYKNNAVHETVGKMDTTDGDAGAHELWYQCT